MRLRRSHGEDVSSLREEIPSPSRGSQPALLRKRRLSESKEEKLSRDPDYRENQVAAQKAWRTRNGDYWRQYRKRNPGYREQNRLRQRERNRQKRMIAKMDELQAKSFVSSGRYRLVPLYGKVAKMDELIVEIGVIAGRYATG